ncbi:MAG: hypothetical protein HYU41_04695 [Candidatus Rokubacteria bacterium]|nr:hypothetical protein [Candidatus Rokubacteria bacterium]
MSLRVFLRHSVSPAELGIVYAIAEEAVGRGMQPYIADRDWDPAEQLPERIWSALREAEVFVAVATQFGNQLAWVNSEIAGAATRPLPIIAILDSSLPAQDAALERARVPILRDALPWDAARPMSAMSVLEAFPVERRLTSKSELAAFRASYDRARTLLARLERTTRLRDAADRGWIDLPSKRPAPFDPADVPGQPLSKLLNEMRD